MEEMEEEMKAEVTTEMPGPEIVGVCTALSPPVLTEDPPVGAEGNDADSVVGGEGTGAGTVLLELVAAVGADAGTGTCEDNGAGTDAVDSCALDTVVVCAPCDGADVPGSGDTVCAEVLTEIGLFVGS